jgi:L-alanine-DL-glutamate epimerase-like enolase superfamily enzyme
MDLSIETFTVHKKFSLQISRGITAKTTNIWLRIQQDDIEAWGEASPFGIIQEKTTNTEQLLVEFKQIIPELKKYHPLERQNIETILCQAKLSFSVRAAIDMALYDWLGKKAGLPLWRLWGLDCSRIVPISVTVGINSPEGAIARVRDWQKTLDVKLVKVKLGNPAGIEADRAMLLAVKEAAPTARLTVDANGGWNFNDAIAMCQWLANQGVEYVEQPLAVGEESKLAALYAASNLPIFVDESCWTSHDIPKLVNSVQGINLKIMKAGGLTEIWRAIHLAQAGGLKIMFGCYSDSSLANTAMSHLAPLADYLDLDSHLNLIDDPFVGATVTEGRLLPSDRPGLGVEYCASNC